MCCNLPSKFSMFQKILLCDKVGCDYDSCDWSDDGWKGEDCCTTPSKVHCVSLQKTRRCRVECQFTLLHHFVSPPTPHKYIQGKATHRMPPTLLPLAFLEKGSLAWSIDAPANLQKTRRCRVGCQAVHAHCLLTFRSKQLHHFVSPPHPPQIYSRRRRK